LRAGLTQAQLAERVGTTQSAIARVERGRTVPSLARVRELVTACGLELRIRLVGPTTDHLARHGADSAPGPTGPDASAAGLAAIADIVRTLARGEVRWIVAGGLAATLHGIREAGSAMTVVPDESRRNLRALAGSLDEMGARIRVDGGSLPFERDPAALRAAGRLELTSMGGPFDLDLRPPGTFGYADLAKDAVAIRRTGLDLLVASLADVVRMVDATEGTDDGVVAALRRRLAAGRAADHR
jgi:transcriptional regulator with XRE-family HTH domain